MGSRRTCREFADVGFHSRVQVVVKAEGIHFGDGLVRGPILLGNTIDTTITPERSST